VAPKESLAYVSLVPGTAPSGVSATIQNSRKGVAHSVAVIDGGFDPVGIAAIVGDTIDVAVTNPAAVVVFQAFVAVRSPHRPVVVRTNPPAKKTDVPLNIIMQVVFSAPIDSTTLTGSIQLLRGATPVPGTLRFTDSTKITAEFIPDDLLAAATSYRLVVSQAIQDLNHLALESPVDVEFRTVPPPPTLSSISITMIAAPQPAWEPLMIQMIATGRFADTDRDVTRLAAWQSSNLEVATVSTTGVLTKVGDGTTTITATYQGTSGSKTLTFMTPSPWDY
jgi:hypothetical protein